MNRDVWIEVSDSFLTDQPATWKGRGKNRHCVPDQDTEPTMAFLTWFECSRTKRRGVRRTHRLWKLTVSGHDDLDTQLERLVGRPDVILVDDGGHWPSYVNSRAEPVPLPSEDQSNG